MKNVVGNAVIENEMAPVDLKHGGHGHCNKEEDLKLKQVNEFTNILGNINTWR